MKNYYLLLFLLFGLFGKAQIVNFPDANFKTILLQASTSNQIASTEIPDFNGVTTYHQIDINNNGEIELSEALAIKYLNVDSSNITNLTGIEAFFNLESLSCKSGQISSLNILSLTNLRILRCDENQLTSLNISGLTNLTSLICDGNQLTSLNVSGLTNLEFLSCSSNNLTSLNVSGLTDLEHLWCEYNQLSFLDVSGLTNLYYLKCYYNQLLSLNVSGSNNLNYLECFNNQLSSLNVSGSNNLYYLACMDNQLTSLDVSGISDLKRIFCENNQLTQLNIKNGNSNWEGLNFNSNPNLQYVCSDEEDIALVQQKIVDYGYANCHVNSYCSFTLGGQFYTIQGQNKFDDENDNCDVTDNFIPSFKYSITDGTTTGSIISNNSGLYSILVQAGSYTITPILENPSYFNVSPTNVVVSFPTQASPVTENFCLIPNGEIHDVEISIIPISVARPGFDCNYKIIYKNKGNQVENGTINLAFDDTIFDFVSSSLATSTQTIGNLNWNYSNLQPFETRSITVVLNLNSPMETPAVNSGDILNYTATNTIANTDEILSDNTFVLNQTVVNSYDPNDKTCLQGNYVGPDKIGEFVHYMIRFENTGTFPAQNIVVKDMIDTAKFDVVSLVPLHASHNYFTKITGNKVEFIFENINLPFDDANNDGYVAFKIKTVPTLVVGNTFSNSANIYFDYNFPIVTNTATTTIAALSNPSFDFATYFSLYPNPATNELNINLKSAIEINSIQIYNTIGQLVTVQTGNALKVDVSNLKIGNYFIKINTNEGFSTSQFIKD